MGAGLAGVGAVRALRELGYPGRVVLVGDEPHVPYDRPPLSKEYLAGAMPVEALRLVAPDEDLDVDRRTGTAVALDPATRRVRLDTGEEVGGDGVVLAAGARARTLPGSTPAGVHTLRSLDDARGLRGDLRPGARLVIVGGGFLGAEVASTARGLGVEVTVVETEAVPLARALGPRVGAACAALHVEHGVRLCTGVAVDRLLGDGDGRVRAVTLADGRVLDADVVLVAVGSVPAVGWLAGSGLDVTGGVLTDAAGATGVPGIVAAGDCTRRIEAGAGVVVRQEHWTNALHQPYRAAASLLGADAPGQPVQATVPYLWSDQYGRRLQFAGHRRPGDEEQMVDGDLAAHRFAVVYRRGGTLVAVLAVDTPRVFTRLRRDLAAVTAPPEGRPEG